MIVVSVLADVSRAASSKRIMWLTTSWTVKLAPSSLTAAHSMLSRLSAGPPVERRSAAHSPKLASRRRRAASPRDQASPGTGARRTETEARRHVSNSRWTSSAAAPRPEPVSTSEVRLKIIDRIAG